jgi:hypothetical protein
MYIPRVPRKRGENFLYFYAIAGRQPTSKTTKARPTLTRIELGRGRGRGSSRTHITTRGGIYIPRVPGKCGENFLYFYAIAERQPTSKTTKARPTLTSVKLGRGHGRGRGRGRGRGHGCGLERTGVRLNTFPCPIPQPVSFVCTDFFLSATLTDYSSRHGNTYPCPTRKRISVSILLTALIFGVHNSQTTRPDKETHFRV